MAITGSSGFALTTMGLASGMAFGNSGSYSLRQIINSVIHIIAIVHTLFVIEQQ